MSVELSERPLVSFAVVAYKQADYIEEAVLSAFAQTYRPLQIILSDDCSPDATFEIMQRLVKQHQGTQQVVLNRNATNLGLSGHLNKVATLVDADWVVMAAGDDVSFPHRVSTLMTVVENVGKPIFAIGSGHLSFPSDEPAPVRKPPSNMPSGEIISPNRLAYNGGFIAPGAVFAYNRRCFQEFPPLPSGRILEDMVLPFRAMLLGGVAMIPLPLVAWRTVAFSMTMRHGSDASVQESCPNCRTLLDDLRVAAGNNVITKKRASIFDKLVSSGEEMRRLYKLKGASGSWFMRWLGIVIMLVRHGLFSNVFGELKRLNFWLRHKGNQAEAPR